MFRTVNMKYSNYDKIGVFGVFRIYNILLQHLLSKIKSYILLLSIGGLTYYHDHIKL